MRREWKLAALRGVLGFESFQKGDECVFFCPKHDHHKPKLSVNVKTDHFNCWICGWKGKNLKPILYLKGRNEEADRYSESIDGRESLGVQATCEKTFESPVLPSDFRSLSTERLSVYGRHAKEYLRRRGISDFDVLRHKLGYCEDGEYKGRVVVPSFGSDGELNFFVGRKIYDHVGLTYKHGEFDKNIIFNDYLVDWDEPVTLVEGPFDAMVAGDNAIPLQGTILNDNSILFAKIVTSGVPVYLALDSDARSKQLEMLNTLFVYGVEVRFIDLKFCGFNDVGEMSKDEFQEMKLDAFVVDSAIAALRVKARA